MSGSRTYFASVGLVFAAYLASALTAPRAASMGRRTVFAVASVVGMALLMTVVFPQAWETMTQRQEDAVAAEGSTLGRAVHMATEMVSAIGQAPPFGFGIGAGTNAGIYAATGELAFTLAEYEWTRIVLECGPVFGLMVIGVRVALTLWCGAIALRANLAHGDAGPLSYSATSRRSSSIRKFPVRTPCSVSVGSRWACCSPWRARLCAVAALARHTTSRRQVHLHGQAQKLARSPRTQIPFRVRRARADAAVARG